MTENDYSIKPLPNLPNVTGPNPAKGGEDRNKRQSSNKQSDSMPHSVEEEISELNDNNDTATVQDDQARQHIDYRA